MDRIAKTSASIGVTVLENTVEGYIAARERERERERTIRQCRVRIYAVGCLGNAGTYQAAVRRRLAIVEPRLE